MANKKNLEPKEGYKNRHIDGLPDKEATIEIINKDSDGFHNYICRWKPFDPAEYSQSDMPSEGYLGTAKVSVGRYEGIGFHAWAQNNSEFVYYKEVV